MPFKFPSRQIAATAPRPGPGLGLYKIKNFNSEDNSVKFNVTRNAAMMMVTVIFGIT